MEAVYTYLCECIECGYTLDSEEHCSSLQCPMCGGQMRRAERPGPGQPRAFVGELPGQVVELTYGEKLRINVSLQYKGPASQATLYGSIGKRNAAFGEIVVGEFFPLQLPNASTWTTVTGSVEVPVTSDIRPGVGYDIYCKLKEFEYAGHPEVRDAVSIVGVPPTYTLVFTHTYDRAKTYKGKAEECSAEFRVDLPEQLFPKNWIVDKIADTFEDKIKAEGAEMLEVKIYEDATPLLWTYYRIVATATKPKASKLSVASPVAWAVIIPLILAIILVALVLALVINVKDIDWGKPAAAIGMGLAIAGVLAAFALAAMVAKKKKK